jgi:hypothetical protein
MKVRCIKLTDSMGNPRERSTRLSIGSVYHVLEVIQDTHHRWLLRLSGDGPNGVAIFGLDQFEIVSPRIPNIWIARWNSQGGFSLTTEAWSHPGYWERFYDRDPEARRVFEDEKTKLVQADP